MPHHEIGDDLRHSFSAFPDGWPGQGLLLLRVTVGLPLVYWGIAGLTARYCRIRVPAADLAEGTFDQPGQQNSDSQSDDQ
jgi:hypothetical protein